MPPATALGCIQLRSSVNSSRESARILETESDPAQRGLTPPHHQRRQLFSRRGQTLKGSDPNLGRRSLTPQGSDSSAPSATAAVLSEGSDPQSGSDPNPGD